jgi:hypothetical protein
MPLKVRDMRYHIEMLAQERDIIVRWTTRRRAQARRTSSSTCETIAAKRATQTNGSERGGSPFGNEGAQGRASRG